MQDLLRFAHDFIAANGHAYEDETRRDKAVLDAVIYKTRIPQEREDEMLRWLNYYKVLMFFPPDRSRAIAQEIIRFADEPHEPVLRHETNVVTAEFERLFARINNVAPRTKADKPRELVSLTSKALWCCYPGDVPIFDRNAANALRVIGRLYHIAPRTTGSAYANFVDTWFQIYKELEPLIDRADLTFCSYKVRVLDRLLWDLGDAGSSTLSAASG